MADARSGADAFIEQLEAAGVPFVFGNPGTTEEPFLSRIEGHEQVRYVTALHEAVAVGAAEGYARASGGVGVVQLHAAPGLGNGLGMLYNAKAGGTPLVVYVGQSEQRGLYLEPTLSGNAVAMATPVAKWAWEVRTTDEIPQVTARALKVAATPPRGPVVLSIPMDLMAARCDAPAIAASEVRTAVAPDPAAVDDAIELIAAARSPVVLAGDGVATSGAYAELAELARLIGAPVYGAGTHEAWIPADEPLDAGRLPSINGAAAERALGTFDTVVAVGARLFAQVFPVPGRPLGDRAVVQVGLDPWELGKSQPGTIVYGDERLAVRALIDGLQGRLDERAATGRRDDAAESIAEGRERALEKARGDGWDDTPMSPDRAVAELAAAMPDDAILVDESLTAYAAVGRWFRFMPGQWFRLRGGGIGHGMPLPVGIALARPGQPVLSIVGDGSAIYTLSALWTAAQHRLPIVWAILNNRSYRSLLENAPNAGDQAPRMAGIDLTNPDLDFVALARGFGVEGHRVERPDEVRPAFEAALNSGCPVLLDVAIGGGPVG